MGSSPGSKCPCPSCKPGRWSDRQRHSSANGRVLWAMNGLCSDTTSSSGGWAHSCAAMGGRKARGFDEISRRLLLLFVVASSMLGANCGAPEEVMRGQGPLIGGNAGGSDGEISSSIDGGTGGVAGSATSSLLAGGSVGPGSAGSSGGSVGTGGGASAGGIGGSEGATGGTTGGIAISTSPLGGYGGLGGTTGVTTGGTGIFTSPFGGYGGLGGTTGVTTGGVGASGDVGGPQVRHRSHHQPTAWLYGSCRRPLVTRARSPWISELTTRLRRASTCRP